MNQPQRSVVIATSLLIFSILIAALLQPTLTDMYFSRQPVMTLEESHEQALKDGYGKVYVIRASVPEIYNHEVEIVKDKINCNVNQYDRIWFPLNSKLAGAWNPTYTAGMRQDDRFYVVWVVGGCK